MDFDDPLPDEEDRGRERPVRPGRSGFVVPGSAQPHPVPGLPQPEAAPVAPHWQPGVQSDPSSVVATPGSSRQSSPRSDPSPVPGRTPMLVPFPPEQRPVDAAPVVVPRAQTPHDADPVVPPIAEPDPITPAASSFPPGPGVSLPGPVISDELIAPAAPGVSLSDPVIPDEPIASAASPFMPAPGVSFPETMISDEPFGRAASEMTSPAFGPEDHSDTADQFAKEFVYDLRPAPIADRLAAWAIDFLICGVVSLLVLGLTGGLFRAIGDSVVSAPTGLNSLYFSGAIGAFLVWGAYHMILLPRTNGQTVGKRLMHVRVVRLDGRPMDTQTALVREMIARSFGVVLLFALLAMVTGALGGLLLSLYFLANAAMVLSAQDPVYDRMAHTAVETLRAETSEG